MTKEPHVRLSKRQVLALRGIRLPALALRTLRETGVYCDPSVSIEYRPLAKLYVLRGRESGGAAGDIGAYCGFVDASGEALPWLSRVHTVGRNGLHAVVTAPELVRLHTFRSGQTCELLVTRHQLKFKAESKRPVLENTVLFHGLQGMLPMESHVQEHHHPSQMLPVFHTRSGEELAIPDIFRDAVIRTVAGARCSGCRHCHVLKPGTERPGTLLEEVEP